MQLPSDLYLWIIVDVHKCAVQVSDSLSYVPAMPAIPTASQAVSGGSLSPSNSTYDMPTLHVGSTVALDREARVMRCAPVSSWQHCPNDSLLAESTSKLIACTGLLGWWLLMHNAAPPSQCARSKGQQGLVIGCSKLYRVL